MLTCVECGAAYPAAPDEPAPQLCLSCLIRAADALTARIDAAAAIGPGAVSVVYVEGMAALGWREEALADVAAADLAGEGVG